MNMLNQRFTGGLIALAAALILAPGAGADDLLIAYEPQPLLATADYPNSLISAQLLGDTRTDVAICATEARSVQVFRNMGGVLVPAQTLFLDLAARFLAAGDFSHDGRLDLVVSSTADDAMSLLLNTGDQFVPYGGKFTTGEGPWELACADLDRDGNLDLVVGYGWTSYITVYYGSEGTAFELVRHYRCSWDPCFPICVDLDGDEVLEVVVLHQDTGLVSVMENDGNRELWLEDSFQLPGGPKCGQAADLNGDGYADLAVTVDNPGDISDLLLIYPGDGAGGFGPATLYPTPGHPVSLVLADLNLDAYPDLLVACYEAGGLRPFLGNGSGFEAQDFVQVGSGVRGLGLINLDGDPDPDVAVAARSENNLYLFANTSADLTAVPIGSGENRDVALSCRPNPFTAETVLSLALHAGAHGSLRIFDSAGRCVRTLRLVAAGPEVQQLVWDGRDEESRLLPAGVYFARYTDGEQVETVKLIRLR